MKQPPAAALATPLESFHMSPAFRSLLLKEWSERRRLFLCGLGILLVYTGSCVAYEVEYQTHAFIASFFSTCGTFGWLGAILLAMSTANGEHTQRTLRFSASLPVSLKQIAWARLFTAWMCLAAPILCAALLVTPLLATGVFEQAELRMDGNGVTLPARASISNFEAVTFLWSMTALSVVMAIYGVTLISLIGTWARSEGAVGFAGAIFALGSMVLTTIRASFEEKQLYAAADWIGAIVPGSLAINWGYQDWDGSNYTDIEVAPMLAAPIAVNVFISLLLGFWFSLRYGSRLDSVAAAAGPAGRSWTSRLLVALSRLGVRWPGPTGSLVWLNSRQSISICLAGLVMAALITLISMFEEYIYTSPTDWFMGALPDATWFVGAVWGVIVAAALFSPELRAGLEHFWRSRSISPAAWFWTKYFVGLASLLLTLDVIPAVSRGLATGGPDTARVGVAYWACIPVVHTLTYSVTVAVICRWRRAMPAAITALLLVFLLDRIFESIPVSARLSAMDVHSQLQQAELKGESVSLTQAGYPIVYGTMFAVIVASVAFARRVVVPPVMVFFGAGLLLTAILVPGPPALAAELPTLAELSERIHQRDESLKRLHLRMTTELHRLPASYELNQPTPRRQRTSLPRPPEFETKTYDLFLDGSRRAWTVIDDKGEVVSRHAFDGALLRTFETKSQFVWYDGSLRPLEFPPPMPVTTPDQLPSTQDGISLQELMAASTSAEVTGREVDGEQLIDIRVTLAPTAPSDSRLEFEHRFEITMNSSRNDWLVRLQREIVETHSGQMSSRQLYTMTGWIERGPISYPREILYEFFVQAPTGDSGTTELTPFNSQRITMDELDIDPQMPESVFTNPFPAGARYLDFRDGKLYQIDSAETTQIYEPLPRGVRGAVLAYHLLWISTAAIYFAFAFLRVRSPQA